MLPFFTEQFGNPANLYSLGAEAAQAVEQARASVAGLVGAKPEEIYFTAGGTESNNWALLGTAWAYQEKGCHLITSAIEHHAVLEPLNFLEKQGYQVTRVPVDSKGVVDPEEVRRALRPDTILVSIMHANNEIGTIQPIAEIGEICHEAGVLFHVDAVQTVGKLPVNVQELKVDMLSASAHKFYGPKGVGFLYLRSQARIGRLLHGGGQERKRRAGTVNVPGVVGMARALELAAGRMAEDAQKERQLRDRLWQGMQENIEAIYLNGGLEQRLPSNLNVRVAGIEGEAMILMLDMEGICVSSGSACTSGSLDPSHVLLAIGIPAEEAHGSLRLTLGRGNTEEDVDYFLSVFPRVVARLREMSPVWCARCVTKQRNS